MRTLETRRYLTRRTVRGLTLRALPLVATLAFAQTGYPATVVP